MCHMILLITMAEIIKAHSMVASVQILHGCLSIKNIMIYGTGEPPPPKKKKKKNSPKLYEEFFFLSHSWIFLKLYVHEQQSWTIRSTKFYVYLWSFRDFTGILKML